MNSIKACLLVPLVWLADPGFANRDAPSLDDDRRYQFAVFSQDLPSVLQEFGASLGVPMTINDDVSGKVSNLYEELSPRQFLDRVSSTHGLAWYFDGNSIHITPVADNRSLMVNFSSVSADELNTALEEIGAADNRFQLQTTGTENIGIVTGPPRFIEVVEAAFAILEQSKTPPVSAATVSTNTAPKSIRIIRAEGTQIWRSDNVVSLAEPDEEPAPIERDGVDAN